MLAIVTGMAWAGDAAKQATATGAKDVTMAASPQKMQEMKAAMMKCAVCKNMATHWDELAPVMTMEVAKLNDGIAMIHGVSDPSKVAMFHADCKLTSTAGEATMAWTDEQAKAQLCDFCNEIRTVMKSGAKMSSGPTKMGDIMIITSADPAVQAKITALGDKCAAMAASM
jgi:hypothetical protein